MDNKSERDKLRALNLIGHTLDIKLGEIKLQGEVFYFSEKVLILKKDSEYLLVNINKFEEMQINCHLNARGSDKLKEELANEALRPADVLGYMLD